MSTKPCNISLVRHKDLILVVGDYLDKKNTVGPEYFYSESTCPYNVCHSVLEVIRVHEDGTLEVDPHGIFEYTGTVDPKSSTLEKDLAKQLGKYTKDLDECTNVAKRLMEEESIKELI